MSPDVTYLFAILRNWMLLRAMPANVRERRQDDDNCIRADSCLGRCCSTTVALAPPANYEVLMPLLDHFHAPLYPQRSWESFHSRWANSIADFLQRTLPERYVAEVQMHLGSQVEADVAELESTAPVNGKAGGVAVQTWAPPVATMVLPAVFPDD